MTTDTSAGELPATRPQLACPECDAAAGQPAGQRRGEPGVTYDCPSCGADWREGAPLAERARTWAAGHVEQLPRFVTEPQPSLQQHLAYATAGDWHPQPDGPARRWHLAHTRLVFVPGAVAAHLWLWAAARPGRFYPLLFVALFLLTALNAVPVVGWLIPDWASATSWPPFSWLED